MKIKDQIWKVVIVLGVGIAFHLLFGFYYHIDKYLNGWIFLVLTFLVPVAFVALCYFAISGIIQIVRNRRNLTFVFCLPTIIACLAIFFPWGFDSENFEEKVEMRACHEGTMSQSTIKFRADSSFEIHSTGIFFASFWWHGRWRKSGDTIVMNFEGKRPRYLSDTIVIRDQYLVPASKSNTADSLRDHRAHYYLGYCRGEN